MIDQTLSPYIAESAPEPLLDPVEVVFEQTVPRHLVHRAAVSEVFLTDLRVTGASTFQVGAQWPRDHSFYRLAVPTHHDPMLLAETIRQAALVIAHRVFEIPLDWKFMSHETSHVVTTAGLALGPRPPDVLLTVTCHDVKRRGSRIAGMTMTIECYRDGRRIGSGRVRWSCVSPAAYIRLRGDRAAPGTVVDEPGPTVPGHLVGRDRSRDVVLSPNGSANSWSLRVDQHHPVLFDHPVDHVPGMVLMEAARQSASLLLDRADVVPVACRFTFDRYVEFGGRTTVFAERHAPSTTGALGVQVRVVQGGQTAAHGLVDMKIVD